MNKEQIEKVVNKFILSYGEEPNDYKEVFYNSKKNIGINLYSYLCDFAEDLSQPTTDLEHSKENVNLWRLRYESLLKGLNDVTNELNVYKVNKDFDLAELKKRFELAFNFDYDCSFDSLWNFFLPHLQKPVESEWIKLKDKKPEREPNVKYSNVPCLVIYKRQVCILCFNHEHECWDDKDGDDYCCDIESIEFWQPLPKPPIQTK